MELKNKLSQLRKEKGLTQQELADALHVSRQTISRWEVGTSIPAMDNLVRLSKLYGVPMDYLVHDEIECPGPPDQKPAGPNSVRRGFRFLLPVVLSLVLIAGTLLFHSHTQVTERNDIMDIINSVRANLYQPVQSMARQTAEAAAGSFTEQAKSHCGASASGSRGYTVILSPALQLRVDYNRWKETQLPQELPGSQGATEENLAYLRERYSGSLTMFRKMEALDTMFDMGIITREQRNAFYGTMEIKTWTAGQVELRSGPLEDGPSTSFSSKMAQEEAMLYRLSPLAKSETLDDLFFWLKDAT